MPLSTYLAKKKRTKPVARAAPALAKKVEKPGARQDRANALAAQLARGKVARARAY